MMELGGVAARAPSPDGAPSRSSTSTSGSSSRSSSLTASSGLCGDESPTASGSKDGPGRGPDKDLRTTWKDVPCKRCKCAACGQIKNFFGEGGRSQYIFRVPDSTGAWPHKGPCVSRTSYDDGNRGDASKRALRWIRTMRSCCEGVH